MINNHLKVERAKRNLTQAQLAQLVGVSRQTINAIEKRKLVPSTMVALRLSLCFETCVNNIFELEEGKIKTKC
jgi:putative transcriptional regulator